MTATQTYVALLRGINVGGHHKVPMADLRKEMEGMGFSKVITLLNSGNVIFEGPKGELGDIESQLENDLGRIFGFPIPVLLRTGQAIQEIVEADPFKEFELTKKIRFYISFLQGEAKHDLTLPWVSEDTSFTIVDVQHQAIISVLDIGLSSTPKGMEALEKIFGKKMTTRNWKTLNRIAGKL